MTPRRGCMVLLVAFGLLSVTVSTSGAAPVGGLRGAPPLTIDTTAGGPVLIQRVIVSIPTGGRLQTFCPELGLAACSDFSAVALGPSANPRIDRGRSFGVSDGTGVRPGQTEVRDGAGGRGLFTGANLDIRLSVPASTVQLGILSDSPQPGSVQALGVDGSVVAAEEIGSASGRVQALRLPHTLATLVAQRPFGVAAAGGLIYVADPVNRVVRVVDPAPGVAGCPCESILVGNGSFGVTTSGADPASVALGGPYGVSAVQPAGAPVEVFVADTYGHQVLRVGQGPDGARTVTVVAGTGDFGFSGDGGTAVSAQLNSPYGVARDPSRRLTYIADTLNNRVRVVRPDGTITTVIGTGAAGFSGDGGPGVAAQLNQPRGLALDSSGNLFVADTFNHAVRRLDAVSGVLTTVAGNGSPGSGGDGGPAVRASLRFPSAVAVGSTFRPGVYIADTMNHRIRVVEASGGNITTYAGNGTPGFAGDSPPGFDLNSPQATEAQLDSPFGVAVINLEVFIADTVNSRVRIVTPHLVATTTFAYEIRTLAGNGFPRLAGDGGPATQAESGGPSAVVRAVLAPPTASPDPAPGSPATTVPPGLLSSLISGASGLVIGLLQVPTTTPGPAAAAPWPPVTILADPFNHSVRMIAADGLMSTLAGTGRRGRSGDGGPASAAALSYPFGVAVDDPSAARRVYIADTFNQVVRMVDLTTGTISTVAGTGTPGFGGDGGPATKALLSFPTSVAVDRSGALYIADSSNARIRMIGGDGVIRTIAGTGTSGSAGDGGPAASAQLFFPYGVSVDGSTPATVYIADSFNNKIRAINGSGVIRTVAGTGSPGSTGDGGPGAAATLARPWSATVEGPPSPGLLIADMLNNRVRHLDLGSGALSTLVGDGTPGSAGDLGPATAARISGPRAAAAAEGERLALIADSFSGRIRRLGVALTGAEPDPVDLIATPPDLSCTVACPFDFLDVTNTGNVAMTVRDVAVGGRDSAEFSISADHCTGTRLPPGGSCQMRVVFSPKTACPTAAVCRQAEVVVSGNAGDSPRVIPVTGRVIRSARLTTEVSFGLNSTECCSDVAIVSDPSGLGVPTGTVTFFFCRPTGVTKGVGCFDTGGMTLGTVALVNGRAVSPRSISNETGINCFGAGYSGDATYGPIGHTNYLTAQVTGGDTPECFEILPPGPK